MMAIVPVPERDKKTSVRDHPHLREKPLRMERPLGYSNRAGQLKERTPAGVAGSLKCFSPAFSASGARGCAGYARRRAGYTCGDRKSAVAAR